MKKIITTIFVACVLALTGFAQSGSYKVTESSARKMPAWVNGMQRGYITATAVAGNIEDAKEAVLANIRQQIAQSIATRVVAESSLYTSYQESGDNFSQSSSLESSVVARTAKLPFIGEISLAGAEEYYWEMRQYRSSKSVECFYAVKYPFSDAQMHRLVTQYQEYDYALNTKLEQYTYKLSHVASLEEIGTTLNELRAFIEEFDTHDPRYNQVQSLSNNFRALYDQITLYWTQLKKGVVVVSLCLGDRVISTSQKPVVKSNCASAFKYTNTGEFIQIEYNDENCYAEDENYIEVRFRAGNKYISEKICIKTTVHMSFTGQILDKESGQPVPYATLYLTPKEYTTVTNGKGVFTFNDVPHGTYILQISKQGYKTDTYINVKIAKDTKYSIYNLTPAPEEPLQLNVPAPAGTAGQNQDAASSWSPDGESSIENGLTAYFRFNGTAVSEISGLQGNPVNSPQYVTGAQDKTSAISFSSMDRSQLVIPNAMIAPSAANYSITFWMKGFTDGHVWSFANGNSGDNFPKLIIKGGRFCLYNRAYYDEAQFNHQSLDHNWHFVAVTVSTDNRGTVGSLYLDGVLVDSRVLSGSIKHQLTKFLLAGPSERGDNAIETTIDNLRVYGSRTLSEREVAEIYSLER